MNKSDSLIRSHTAESVLRHPIQMMKDIWRDLVGCRELAWTLAVRDFKAQYRQSFLGILWAFLPPIFMAIGLTAAKNANVIQVGQTSLPYPAYVMLSITLWQTFISALNGPIMGLRSGKAILTKVNFPREAVILAEVIKVLFNLFFQTILVVAVFVWYQIPAGWATFTFAPISLLLLILLGSIIGLFLAPVAMLYSDVSSALTHITQWWLVLTPVVYNIPANNGLFATLVKINPVTPLLVGTRELATLGYIMNPLPFWIVTSALPIVGFLALVYFRVAIPLVVERWSS